MNSYEITATVQEHGQVHLAGVPFAAGTEVEVKICPKARSAEERRACGQGRPGRGAGAHAGIVPKRHGFPQFTPHPARGPV